MSGGLASRVVGVLAVVIVFGRLVCPVLAQPFEVGTHISAAIDTPDDYDGIDVSDTPRSAWFHVLQHPGATYIAIHFVGFALGPDDYLIISDGQGGQEYRMSGRGKMNAGTFWARRVKGDCAILELIVAGTVGGRGFQIDEYVAGDVDLWSSDPAKAICGTDDLLNAACFRDSHPITYDRSRAVVRLLTNGSAFCTGSLVSPDNHVLTNNHCISTIDKALNTDYEFMAEAPNCSDANCPDCYPGVVFSGGTLVRASGLFDYCLIQLNQGDAAATYGYLEFDNRPPALGERIYVPQHPRGRAKEIALYSTQGADSDGVAHVQSVTEPPCLAPAGSRYDVGYYADTEPGSSGSPVLAASTHKLIALHHCGGCLNVGVPVYQFYPEIENHILGFSSPGRIAQGAVAVSADSSQTGWEAEMAIDGDINTQWNSSSAGTDHWLQLDLGLQAVVTEFKVWHAGAGGGSAGQNTIAFTIESAQDALEPWVIEFIGDNAQSDDLSVFEYGTTRMLRHVRLRISDPGIDTTARIPEFEVIAEPWMLDETPLGLNAATQSAQALASSVFSSSNGPEKAIDGVISVESKWTSQNVVPPHTLTLDLGGVRAVGGFVLRQPSAAGEDSQFNACDVSFQSARSIDGPWFTEARVLSDGAADAEARRFVMPKDLRYVRLHVDDPGVDYYARVPEFEIIEFAGVHAAFSASPVSGRMPLSVQFADASAGAITQWYWDFGDGAIGNTQHPNHTYEFPGDYTVSLAVSDGSQDDAEVKTAYIHVMSIPPDIDADGDVDQSDFGLLQACFSGEGVSPDQMGCGQADLDGDDDVDQNDFSVLQACMTGEAILANSSCLD